MATIFQILGVFSAFALAGISFFWGRRSLKKKLLPNINVLSELKDDLSGSSKQVASVSHEISSSSQDQIDTLSSTVTASHEIRSMIEKTSESSETLRSSASQLLGLTKSGNRAVEEMVASSQDVKASMAHFNKEMQQTMAELANAMAVIKEIAAKTEIINTIVFQTKLLSFNASVEAARAGEAGKGFAVVAEEVGNLARMSGTAANEISEIVERSHKVASGAIEATRSKIESLTKDTLKKSDLGFTNAKACAETFSQMTAKIAETNGMIEHITQAAAEQTQGVSQLDESIRMFQEAADRNRLVASMGSEHANEFSRQTDTLSEIVRICETLVRGTKGGAKKLKKFIWNKRLELGAPEMDREHKILIEKINILVTTLEQQYVREDKPALLRAFQDLANFTVEHFTDEENFMESCGYPQLSSHKKIHKHLLDQVAAFGEEIKLGKVDDVKLVSFLQNWLISHIMGVDMKYAEHYKAGAGSRHRAA